MQLIQLFVFALHFKPGPLPDTIADFWEMVWEQRSPVIVMLTKLEERGKVGIPHTTVKRCTIGIHYMDE